MTPASCVSFPKISIVTPSFNQAQFLEACIDSILSQGYSNLEYIIMDGGSTDGSVEIIKRYEKYLSFWQSCPDGGHYHAVQAGFARSSGELMGWLNSDDMLHPDGLNVIAETFNEDSEVEWITGARVGFDGSGNARFYDFTHSRWCRDALLTPRNFEDPFLCIMQEGTYWRRSLWQRAGATLDLKLKFAADFELWARFFRYAKLHTVDALTGGFRHWGEAQRSASGLSEYIREATTVITRELKLMPTDPQEVAPPLVPARWKKNLVRRAAVSGARLQLPTKDARYPLISIVVLVENAEQRLDRIVNSINAQQWPNLQVIFVDRSGSEIVARFALPSACNEAVVVKSISPTATLAEALHAGFSVARGEILNFTYASDCYLPNCFGLAAGAFQHIPTLEWLVGRPCTVAADGALSSISCFPAVYSRRPLLYGNFYKPFFYSESIFWKRSLWEKAGARIDTRWSRTADLELWLRFSFHSELVSLNKLLAASCIEDRSRYEGIDPRVLVEARQLAADHKVRFGPSKFDAVPPPPPIMDLPGVRVQLVSAG